MSDFFDSSLFTWVLLPLLIFTARIVDVSIGTMRIIMIGQGRKVRAALCGFFEVSIWLLAARQVIVHLPNSACFIAYAGGFSAGSFVGMWLEEKLAIGVQMIRIVTQQEGAALISALTQKGYGVTSLPAQGSKGKVNLIFVFVKRCDVKNVVRLIEQFNPRAFFTIEDVRRVNEGVFPPSKGSAFRQWMRKNGK